MNINPGKLFVFKYPLIILSFLLFGVSCSQDDDPSIAERSVVSDDGSVTFEELVMLINIKTSDSMYLVVESVDSINIFVNDFYWAKVNSEKIDTTKVSKQTDGNRHVTNNKLNYLVLSHQDVEEPEYTTAGAFAEYMNKVRSLEPVDYACLIESFRVTFTDGKTQTYYPYKYTTFKVDQGVKSSSLGELQINID